MWEEKGENMRDREWIEETGVVGKEWKREERKEMIKSTEMRIKRKGETQIKITKYEDRCNLMYMYWQVWCFSYMEIIKQLTVSQIKGTNDSEVHFPLWILICTYFLQHLVFVCWSNSKKQLNGLMCRQQYM